MIIPKRKEGPEEQIFIEICPDRHPALRQMRAEIPPGNMGKKTGRKKDRLGECSNRLANGVKKCGDSETQEEGALNRAVMEAIHRITRNEGDFVGAFRQNVIRVIGSYGREQQPDEYIVNRKRWLR